MRPYMLWLTRVYAGHGGGRGTMFLSWPNVVSDWARRLREHDSRSATFPRPVPEPPYWYIDRATRKRMMSESQPLEARRYVARLKSRGAVQGGR